MANGVRANTMRAGSEEARTIDGQGITHTRIAHCIECRRVSGILWTRWRAYRVDDPETDTGPEIAFYCPNCAVREFGPPRRRPLVDRRRHPR